MISIKIKSSGKSLKSMIVDLNSAEEEAFKFLLTTDPHKHTQTLCMQPQTRCRLKAIAWQVPRRQSRTFLEDKSVRVKLLFSGLIHNKYRLNGPKT